MEVLHFNLSDQIGLNHSRVSDHVQERFQLILFFCFTHDLFGVFWSVNILRAVFSSSEIQVKFKWRQNTTSKVASGHNFADKLQVLKLDLIYKLLT